MHLLLQNLKKAGWHIKTEDYLFQWPPEITHRYTSIPSEISHILSGISECVSPDEKSWLLCLPDYLGKSTSAFKWNEFECQSRETATGDKDWLEKISCFWDKHLPIFISVKDGYEYAAVSTKQNTFGRIFCGREPEYEEANFAANSYSEFLEQLTN